MKRYPRSSTLPVLCLVLVALVLSGCGAQPTEVAAPAEASAPTAGPPTEAPAATAAPTETPEAAESLEGLDAQALGGLLADAIRADDASEVGRLLEAGADTNYEISSGPIIVVAAARGDPEVIKLLAEHGADLNAQSSSGTVAMTVAARNGNTAAVEALLDAGVDVDSRDGTATEKNTGLVSAAFRGQTEVVELLIDRGADVDLAAGDGITPLAWAATAGHPDIVEYLLGKGAEVDTPDASGLTALHGAARYSDQVEIVQMLIEAGADVNAVSDLGQTPLDVARGEDIIEVLRQAGATE